MLYLKISSEGAEFISAAETITSYVDVASVQYQSGSSAQNVGASYGIHTVDIPFPDGRPYSEADAPGTRRTTRVLLASTTSVTALGSASIVNSVHAAAVRFGEENLAAVIDSEFPRA